MIDVGIFGVYGFAKRRKERQEETFLVCHLFFVQPPATDNVEQLIDN
jgi:hypothetical protein